MLGISKITNNFLTKNGIDQITRQQTEFPITHWIMMTLNPSCDGGYVQEDVDYTSGIQGIDEKKVANVTEIKKRLLEMGAKGTLDHVFIKKILRMWSVGHLNASDYVSRQPLSDNIIREIVGYGGKYNFWYCFVTQVYYIYLLLMMLVVPIRTIMYRKLNEYILVHILIIIGIFSFFLIWECNSRYLFSFIPVLMIVSSFGSIRD
jgi:hypothetical protein